MTLQEKALDIAITQLGVREDPGNKNRGKQVEKYLAAVGLGPGYAWCMAFVYWCFNEASDKMARKNPLYLTGGVLDQWRRRKDQFRGVTPQPGDVFIMDYGKGTGHTGLVEKVNEDGTIDTIEGNTNDEGSREGYEVCRRKRNRSAIHGYLRFQ
ncbi:CHAP domain-containing protein [Niastella caeni]|uniref:CHAP domain-containing protein n=1 Tax=Niastella caeni TaxID=2569763 RepID=A0A4S8HGS6_9BACT|nr:CHAP domain-containing protein [Niastella caeni]THU34237.1 CHAP domain-containing protein [Niastella caeni]